MSRRHTLKRIFTAVICPALILIGFAVLGPGCSGFLGGLAFAQGAGEPVGSVTVVEGSARVFRRDRAVAERITAGTPIHSHDTIVTGSDGRLRIRFVDESAVSVGYETTLTIDEYVYRPDRGTLQAGLRLLLGKVRCLVTRLAEYRQRRFTVRTNTAVTGVRGTDLVVWAPSDARTDVADLDENVSVASSQGGSPVELRPGTWTRVNAGHLPEAPMALTAEILALFLEGLLENVPITASADDFTAGRVLFVEVNYCRDKAKIPSDPYFVGKGSWGQDYDDQWAIKRVGFLADASSAWHIEDGAGTPVVVAVIDTGLDWNHADLDWKNIWKNPGEIPDNGKDDDGNGYVDDVIGWNFIDRNNKPWDRDGHGTFVSGIIAASWDNALGIAGINRGAKIMVLKAINDFGHTRAANLSEAIFYAADNGARVINISAGGKHLTRTEQEAIDYAYAKGAVIVVAAGNEAVDTKDYSPAGLKNVLTVAATDTKDKRANFSNWGGQVDLAAPGMDVLSLRARRTDLMLSIPDVRYEAGQGFVGEDRRYYRASGTSFAAPIVAGTASLLFARRPELTNVQVERMLLNSARDIDYPGKDQFTGFGLLDARVALTADPDYFLTAQVAGVKAVMAGKQILIAVIGTAAGSDFGSANIYLGFGEKPERWKKILTIKGQVQGGELGRIAAGNFTRPGNWTIRLEAKDRKGKTRESRATVKIQ